MVRPPELCILLAGHPVFLEKAQRQRRHGAEHDNVTGDLNRQVQKAGADRAGGDGYADSQCAKAELPCRQPKQDFFVVVCDFFRDIDRDSHFLPPNRNYTALQMLRAHCWQRSTAKPRMRTRTRAANRPLIVDGIEAANMGKNVRTR